MLIKILSQHIADILFTYNNDSLYQSSTSSIPIVIYFLFPFFNFNFQIVIYHTQIPKDFIVIIFCQFQKLLFQIINS